MFLSFITIFSSLSILIIGFGFIFNKFLQYVIKSEKYSFNLILDSGILMSLIFCCVPFFFSKKVGVIIIAFVYGITLTSFCCLIYFQIKKNTKGSAKTNKGKIKNEGVKQLVNRYINIETLANILFVAIIIYAIFLYPIPSQDDSKYHSLFVKLIHDQWTFRDISLTSTIAPGFINETIRSYTLLAHFFGAFNFTIYSNLFISGNPAIYLNIIFKFFFFLFILRFYIMIKIHISKPLFSRFIRYSFLLLTPHLWYMLKWYPYAQLFGMITTLIILDRSLRIIRKNNKDKRLRIINLFIIETFFVLTFFLHIIAFFFLLTVISAIFIYQIYIIIKRESLYLPLFVINFIIIGLSLVIFLILLIKPNVFTFILPNYSHFFTMEKYAFSQPMIITGNTLWEKLFFISKTFYISAIFGFLGACWYFYDIILRYKKNIRKERNILLDISFIYFGILQTIQLLIFQFFPFSLPSVTLFGKMHRLIPLMLIFIYPILSGYFLLKFVRCVNNIIVNYRNCSSILIFSRFFENKNKKFYVKLISVLFICVLLIPLFISIQFYSKPQYNDDEIEAMQYLISIANNGDIILNDYMGQWIPILTKNKNVLITYPFITCSEEYTRARAYTIDLFVAILVQSPSSNTTIFKLKEANISFILFNTYEESDLSVRQYLSSQHHIFLVPEKFNEYSYMTQIYSKSNIYIYQLDFSLYLQRL